MISTTTLTIQFGFEVWFIIVSLIASILILLFRVSGFDAHSFISFSSCIIDCLKGFVLFLLVIPLGFLIGSPQFAEIKVFIRSSISIYTIFHLKFSFTLHALFAIVHEFSTNSHTFQTDP